MIQPQSIPLASLLDTIRVEVGPNEHLDMDIVDTKFAMDKILEGLPEGADASALVVGVREWFKATYGKVLTDTQAYVFYISVTQSYLRLKKNWTLTLDSPTTTSKTPGSTVPPRSKHSWTDYLWYLLNPKSWNVNHVKP